MGGQCQVACLGQVPASDPVQFGDVQKRPHPLKSGPYFSPKGGHAGGVTTLNHFSILTQQFQVATAFFWFYPFLFSIGFLI